MHANISSNTSVKKKDSHLLKKFVYHGSVSLQSLNERIVQDTACFGTGQHSLIDANCSSTEKIYPIKLNVGAKLSSSGCPSEMESNATDLLVQQCCLPDLSQDCVALVYTYVPDIASSYLESCVGRQTCQTRQAFRMDVLSIPACNSSIFPAQTHYMYLDYYCIPDAKIGRFPTADLTNDGAGSFLYLQGSTYPFQISETSVTCSLETDCFTNINIYGLHVNFHLDNVTCNQAILMNDTSGTLYTVGCPDNDTVSGYRIRTLATSNDNYMEIHYTSIISNQGLFWLAFNAPGNLSLNCPRRDPINQCLTTTTTTESTTTTTTEPTTTTTTEPTTTTTTTELITTTTTPDPMTTATTTEIPTTPTTTTTTTTSETALAGASSEGDSDNSIIIIAIAIVVVVVLIAAVIAAGVYYFKCYKKKKSESSPNVEEGVNNEDIGDEQETGSVAVSTSDMPVQEPESEKRTIEHTDEGGPSVLCTLPPILHAGVQQPDNKGEKKKKKKRKKRRNENIERALDDGHIYTTEENDNENRKKKRRKHKRSRSQVSPETPCGTDDIPLSNPIDNHANEFTPMASGSHTIEECGQGHVRQEIDQSDEMVPKQFGGTGVIPVSNPVQVGNNGTDDNQSKKKKKRKRKKRHRESMDAEDNNTGVCHTDETLHTSDLVT